MLGAEAQGRRKAPSALRLGFGYVRYGAGAAGSGIRQIGGQGRVPWLTASQC